VSAGAKNLYESIARGTPKIYIGTAVCGEQGPFVLADGQATCEKCAEGRAVMICKNCGEHLQDPGPRVGPDETYEPPAGDAIQNDPNMKWVVALAQGFRSAGCTRSPIAPDPEVIRQCIESLDRKAEIINRIPEELQIFKESLTEAAPDLLRIAYMVVQNQNGMITPGIAQKAKLAIQKAQGRP
jgi:hypothetical protein